MRVGITRIDPSLPLPAYASAGAAGFDLYARIAVTVAPGTTERVPANVILAIAPGFCLVVSLRSSTPLRMGLIAPHGIGVIDSDYRGGEDEIAILVHNVRDEPVTVQRGERIAQGLIIPDERAEWVEQSPKELSRGGFGSTG